MNGFRRIGRGAAAAALCALPVGAGVAVAGYQAGGFGGETDQMEPIAFRAVDGKVKKLSTTVYAECEDATRQRITVLKGRTRVADDRFSLKLEGDSALSVVISGKLRGQRAAGRIEASVKPPGTSCAADLRWSATLAKRDPR